MKEKYQTAACDESYEISLSKLTGKTIVDIVGWASSEFDCDAPVFKASRIIFADGSHEWLEGEHDIAYVPDGECFEKDALHALLVESGECQCGGDE